MPLQPSHLQSCERLHCPKARRIHIPKSWLGYKSSNFYFSVSATPLRSSELVLGVGGNLGEKAAPLPRHHVFWTGVLQVHQAFTLVLSWRSTLTCNVPFLITIITTDLRKVLLLFPFHIVDFHGHGLISGWLILMGLGYGLVAVGNIVHVQRSRNRLIQWYWIG